MTRLTGILHEALSLFIEQLGSHWTDFRETLYLNIFFFQNVPEKFEIINI